MIIGHPLRGILEMRLAHPREVSPERYCQQTWIRSHLVINCFFMMWFISMNHIGTMFFVGGEPMICMHNCTDCKRTLSITARDRRPQQVRRSRFGPIKLGI